MKNVENRAVRRAARGGARVGVLSLFLACSLVSANALGQPPSQGKPQNDAAPTSEVATDSASLDVKPASARALREAEPHNAEELQLLADQIRLEVETVRELKNFPAVPLVVRSEAQLRSYIFERIDELGEPVISAAQRVLQLLGVLESDGDYAAIVMELLSEQVAGYYEPEDKRFYILDSDIENFDPAVIAHELQHAAQDANWDLDAFMRPAWRLDDIQASRSALIEGDAMLTMLAYASGTEVSAFPPGMVRLAARMMLAGLGELHERYPRYIIDGLVSGYAQGLMFAHALYESGGWAAVNAAFETPPLSSEQVLYPERYLNGDEPTLLSFDVPAGVFGERLDSNVMGMASIRHLFAHLLDGRLSIPALEQATSLWDGDRLELWSRPEGDVLVWLSVFDEEHGAQDFFDLLEFSIPRWVTGVTTCAGGLYGNRCGVLNARQGVLIERWGDLTLLVLAENRTADVDTTLLFTAAGSVWSSYRRASYPRLFR